MKQIAALLMTALAAMAQSPSKPEFDVASVKLSDIQPTHPYTTFRESAIRISGNRVSTRGTVTELVLAAYQRRSFQVAGSSGLPDKAGIDQWYEIEARTPGEGIPSMDLVRRMLAALLADCFRLTFHRERREMPVYYLITGNTAPKLKQSSPDADTRTESLPPSAPGNIKAKFTNLTMAEFVLRMSPRFDRPLIDKTGLEGGYDFTLETAVRRPALSEMSAAEAAAFEKAGPPDESLSITSAIPRQLGLKLSEAKEKVEVLVIDHVQKPSAN